MKFKDIDVHKKYVHADGEIILIFYKTEYPTYWTMQTSYGPYDGEKSADVDVVSKWIEYEPEYVLSKNKLRDLLQETAHVDPDYFDTLLEEYLKNHKIKEFND